MKLKTVPTSEFYARRAFNLRMPETLRLRLIEIAEDNGRSLNAEIVQRLRASLEGYSQDLRR